VIASSAPPIPVGEVIVLVTTGPNVEGHPIVAYHGLVGGDAILGANVFKDMFAGIRDIVGGRSQSYERELRKAKDLAVKEMQEAAAAMGANAVIGVDLDYETVGQNASMLMVSVSGTAVTIQ
jgi:uncharacterized protein YbjQ (UPF0145 family)